MTDEITESAKTTERKDGPKASRPYMPGYGIKPANEGGGLLPWSWALERLEASRGYWVSTVRPDGAPHCAAVWGVWLDDKFLFSTGAQSRKAQNLAANPKCVVCIDRTEQAISVEGTVARCADESLIARFRQTYQEKYGWDMSGFSEPVFIMAPTKAFAITESSGEYTFAGSATRWTFGG
ncbi:MAG TPA: pyridoxamine 5'-phosphate oxidase family protein [Blastocatellia bacterium]|nr:pyridoxamine 5'-phosphate oxidase family protein [Blastocatellia bacterium]